MLRRSIVLLCYKPSQTIIHIIVEEKRIKNIPTWRGNVSSEDQRCYWQQKSWSSDDCAQIPQKLSEREDLPSQVFQISNFRLPTWYFRRGILGVGSRKKIRLPDFPTLLYNRPFFFSFLDHAAGVTRIRRKSYSCSAHRHRTIKYTITATECLPIGVAAVKVYQEVVNSGCLWRYYFGGVGMVFLLEGLVPLP